MNQEDNKVSIMEKVGVILVNYNGAEYTDSCIESVARSSYTSYEIIIVDNASTDDSISKIESKYGNKIHILKNRCNDGFAKANNRGIEYALQIGCDLIMLLNNDTVVEENLIFELVNCSKKNTKSIISPKIMHFYPNDLIWSAGGEINWIKGNTLQYGYKVKENEYTKAEKNRKVGFATGCCMLIPKEVIEEIGLLEESYFLYYEDTDYCMKAKEKGINIIYCHSARMYHKVSATTGGSGGNIYIYYSNRNRLYFNKKYNKNRFFFWIFFILGSIKKILKWIITRQFKLIKVLIMAICDYKSGVKGKVTIE